MTSLNVLKSQRLVTAAGPAVERVGLLRHSSVRFLLAGGLSTGIDMGLLYVLHGLLHVQLPVAAFASIAVSYVLNFALNRAWSFGSQSAVGAQLARYLALAGLNWVATAGGVSGLAALGLNYLVAKVLMVVLNSIANYFVYKHWVFRRPAG